MQLVWIYQYFKDTLPPNINEDRGRDIIVTCFVDANHSGNQKDRRTQTVI